MNLIEIAEQLKDVPDQYLLQEVQRPTGNYPSYLVVSELGRRKRMRESVAKEMPRTTVTEDLTAPQRQQAMAQMAQMLQPQDQNMIPQAGGLNALPQAQQDLAAMDMVSAQPQMAPEMASEVPAMAGGGMVSFRQGGDVIRAFDGLPSSMFPDSVTTEEDIEAFRPRGFGSIFGLAPEGLGSGNIDYQLSQLGYPREQITSMDPATKRYIVANASTTPSAVAPAPRPVATTPTTPAGAPSGTPSGAPAGQTRPSVPPLALRQTVARPSPLTDLDIQSARTQRLSEFERAVPDTLSPLIASQIQNREKDIAARRASNINEALMQAGLGIMASKSPRFLQAAGEGGTSGLNVFREGLKNIRQSQELNEAANIKMAEAKMLRGERKFKAADDAERSARQNNEAAVALYNADSAVALRELQAQIAAQKAPHDIAESQARAAAYGARGVAKPMTAEERMLLEPQAVARLKRRGISNPTDAQIDAEIAALRGMSSAEPATALDRGTI